jgi:UDP-N-acetylmuramyl tripeptide synthase
VNSSALVNRMNFALQLGSGRLPGITTDPQAILRGATPQDANAALAVMENSILAGDVSAQTHAVILKQLDDPQITQRRLDDPAKTPNYGAIAGLIMGSPEFQKR